MPKKYLGEQPCACGCGERIQVCFNYTMGRYTQYKRGHFQRAMHMDMLHKETPWRNEAWLRHQYVELEKTQKQIAEENDCHQTTILNWMRHFKIPVRPQSWYRGHRHPRYKGGTIDGHGYHVITDTDGRRKRTHRAVMERVLGRPLHPDEIVHHIDGDKLTTTKTTLKLCRVPNMICSAW